MNNRPYEISIWDDVLTYEVEHVVQSSEEGVAAANTPGTTINGSEYIIDMTKNAGVLSYEKNETGTQLVYDTIERTASKDAITDEYKVVTCNTKEKKIGIIGSNLMTAQHRALNGKLVENVNGSRTLTFSMYYKYYDNETGEHVENPFVKLLTNERKVKLRLGNPGDADVEWYDFVIKNVQESSDSKVFNYTCTDLFINELSKNGYNITLDGELENNIGTPDELAEFVLAGTDWKLGESDLIHTYNEEPVYRIAFSSEVVLTPVSQKAGDPKKFTLPANAGALVFYSSLMAREKEIQILCALDKDGNIDGSDGPSREWVMDEDGRVVASEHTDNPRARQFIVPVTFTENNVLPEEVASKDFNTNNMDLRGRRIARAQETKYDTNLGKYVSRYTKKGDPEGIYWCFAESNKSELTVLNNYVTNPSAFKDTSGWEVLAKEPDKAKVSFVSSYTSGLVEVDKNGDFKNKNLGESVTSWIRMEFGDREIIGNTGLWDYLYDYDKITKGDVFILGVVYDLVESNGDPTKSPNVQKGQGPVPIHSIRLFESKWSNASVVADVVEITDITKIVGNIEKDKYENWHFYSCTFNTDISHKELVEKELRLCFKGNSMSPYYLREAMLFKKYLVRDVQEEVNGQQMDITEVVYDESEATRYLLPGKFTNRPLSFPEYKIYLDGTSEDQDLDSMKYLLETKDITVLEQSYIPYYDPKAAARVQVTAKESNRFNILQDIAEAAQCWVKFSIKHNAHTGHIEMDEQKKPIKQVSFHQFAGKNNSAGFKYGINLKSIQRTIESNQLTSKLIVKPNSNEFADAKQCAIGKAQSNPTKEDIIYNLNYYINHGMIGYETWMDDMYGQTESDEKICYQKKMKEIVKNYDKISEQVVYYSNLLNKLESECTVYKEARDAAVAARRNAFEAITDYCNRYTYNEYIDLVKGGKIEIVIKNGDKEERKLESSPTTIQGLKTFCTLNFFQFPKQSIESFFVHYVADKMIEIDTLSEKIYNYDVVLKDDPEVYPNEEDRATGLVASLEKTKEEYKNLKNELKKIKAAREELENRLFSRYGRFIQEGTWISEDYFDNELYYLEAVNVSNTSAFPQVSYTINVIDVSRVEGYENITFAVGDKSYIQDTEFFGWKMVDKIHKTPYKEEVICSEVARVLDDGSQNTIKVQNYKNQFEDLFQRINATTQQVQYKSGEYQKAANAFTEDGELQNGLLSAALERNTSMLQNATNESVAWDNTGITTFNKNSPNLITRIVGGGIMVSNDGGTTWGHAITGEGINANYLCAGTIDAGTINIRSGEEAAFTWDVKGISAYASRYKDANGNIQDLKHFDPSTFVRFDQFGIYGVQNDSNFFAKTNSDININNGVIPFALTWEGFFFRTGDVGTGVTIDSKDDICVREGGNPKVKIGRIKGSNGQQKYGLIIYDVYGNPAIEQGDDGNLQIKGTIYAEKGKIGGTTIHQTYLSTDPKDASGVRLYGGFSSSNLTAWVLQVGPKDNVPFYVTNGGHLHASDANINGVITATEGEIGGWTISSNSLSWTNGSATAQLNPSNIGKPGYEVFGITDSDGHYSEDGGFYVSGTGILHANNAVINGTLTAGPGSKISTWTIDNNSIHNGGTWGENTFMCTGSGSYHSIGGSGNINGWVFGAGGRFGVTKDGAVWCSNISANGGKVGGWNIGENMLWGGGDASNPNNFLVQDGRASFKKNGWFNAGDSGYWLLGNGASYRCLIGDEFSMGYNISEALSKIKVPGGSEVTPTVGVVSKHGPIHIRAYGTTPNCSIRLGVTSNGSISLNAGTTDYGSAGSIYISGTNNISIKPGSEGNLYIYDKIHGGNRVGLTGYVRYVIGSTSYYLVFANGILVAAGTTLPSNYTKLAG